MPCRQQLASQVNNKIMKLKQEQSTMIRITTMALITAMIAWNNHWTITVGFIYIIFTLEIQGKLLLDLLQDMLKVIGKINKIENKNL
jgi:hypothetical protein